MEEKIDVLSKESERLGFLGKFETWIRSFRTLAFSILLLPLVVLYIVCMGVSLSPGIYLFTLVNALKFSLLIKCLLLGVSLAIGFFVFSVMLIFTTSFFNLFIKPFVKPCRINAHSIETIPWYYHNGLVYLVRYTVLNFFTPTPLNILFYRMMGMKIGKGVLINTTNISDPCLITLEDHVTIGGSATLFAHYATKGFLVIDKLHVSRKSNIGLRASLMGNVVIGENVTVKPHTVLLPKSRIDDNEVI